jgi:two-component system, cell cycle sensor histidine kinase and response regulator CckA
MTWSLPAYADFLETLPDAALVVEGGDRILLANTRALDLLGFERDALLEQPLTTVLPPAAQATLGPGLGERFSGSAWWLQALDLRRGDGREIRVELTATPLPVPGQTLALLRDAAATGHGPAHVTVDRLQQAVRVSRIGIFDHDQVNDTIYWSPEQRANYGWGLEERVTLDKFLAQVHPADLKRIAEAVHHAHDPSGPGLFDVEHRIIRRDGKVRWLITRSQTFFAGEGPARRPVRTVGAVQDVTGQRDAAEALRIKDQAIATAFNGFAITDPEGRLAYVNPAFLRMWGYDSESDVLGRPPPDFAADHAATLRVMERLRTVGHWQGELVARRKDGTSFDVLLSASAVRDVDGRVVSLMASFLDITEQKRLESQLRQAQKMESIGRLAGGVAHDFNNLLTAITGQVELGLLDVRPTEPLHEVLTEIHRAADSAANLTRQLLTFSRQQMIDPRVLDLNQVVDHLRRMLQRLLGEHIQLLVRPAPDLGSVRVDRGQFEQVLMNLAINGRDAMPSGGKLTIETANVTLDGEYVRSHPHVLPGEYVMLGVTDEGVGMSEEVRAHLFEPFYTTKAQGKGTGLGLAMVYGAVKQNGGSVEVYSEPGHGTVFRIYLPRVEAVPEPLPGQEAGPVAGGTETIVLVEDEDQVRAVAVQLLTRQGYAVHAFANGTDTLRMLPKLPGPLHLLITDVVLPGMNGWVLAQQVKALRPDIKVLYTSGYGENVVIHHGVLTPGIEFIPKPYSLERLASRVREVLDKVAD